MDAAAFRIAFALIVLTVVVAEAVNEDAVHRTRRKTYLGFPRLGRGRGYLALPRMGRSSPSEQDSMGFERNSRGYLALPRMGRSSQNEADTGSDAACCKMGLKKEWLMAEDDKMSPKDVCQDGEFCCPGLEEVQDTKPDGSFYTMCVPKCRQNGGAAIDNAMLRFSQMLRN